MIYDYNELNDAILSIFVHDFIYKKKRMEILTTSLTRNSNVVLCILICFDPTRFVVVSILIYPRLKRCDRPYIILLIIHVLLSKIFMEILNRFKHV